MSYLKDIGEKIKEEIKPKENIETIWGELVGWDLTIYSYKSTGNGDIYIKNGCNTLFYIRHGILLYVKKEIFEGIKNKLGIDDKECANHIRIVLITCFSLRISNEPIGVFKD